jgi:thiol-disulfide isomerase/thioredoxin
MNIRPFRDTRRGLKERVRNLAPGVWIFCLVMIPPLAGLAADPIDPGDPAPALNPAKWLKGAPIARFEPGQVYVVEFWATWCGPCKANIPHLTELAHQYKDRVSIAGISIWESTDPTDLAYLQKVEKFVQEQGDKMDYHVAVDGPHNEVANAWMAAAGEKGIPASFIVGKDGRIAWIGYPANLGEVLQQVLADKFDVAAAKRRRDVDLKLVRPLDEALTNKDYKRALELIDAIVAQQPNLAPAHDYNRLIALYHIDLPGGIALSDKILADSHHDIGAYRMMASIFATQTNLSPAAYEFGQKLMAEALKKGEMTYLFLAMNADLRANMGDKAGAVKSQEQAVAAAEKDSHAPPDFVESMKKKLDKLKAAL